MKTVWLRSIVLGIAIGFVEIAAAAPAVVLVVRHAEKEAAPADDPALTAKGKQRAVELVRVVQTWSAAGAPVSALFATEVKRTQQTLAPLAASVGVKVSTVNAKDTAGLVKQILAVDGGIVVVAGHSNTVPALIKALGGPPGIVVGDAEFDRLFAVIGAGSQAHVVALRYGAASDPANASHM